MQIVQKRNLQLCMQKVRQNDLNFSENPFFVFDMLIYFYVNVSSNFVIQEWTRYPKSVFEKTLTVSHKSSSNDRKVVEKQKSTIFGNFTRI